MKNKAYKNYPLHTQNLLNSTILHNGEGNPLTALIDVVLGEYEGTVLGDKVTIHAGEYPAVKS